MPSLGAVVKYAVTAADSDRVTRTFGRGVIPNAGDVLPAICTKDKTTKCDLQVFLNGEGTFWVQDVLNSALVP